MWYMMCVNIEKFNMCIQLLATYLFSELLNTLLSVPSEDGLDFSYGDEPFSNRDHAWE